MKQLKKICDYQCKLSGGYGVLREIAELIFERKFQNKYKSY
jgi:3-deoxy-D-manno-octulosonate 8-phosphate phosphatase KdsC-like HAD superfamily phosphatase